MTRSHLPNHLHTAYWNKFNNNRWSEIYKHITNIMFQRHFFIVPAKKSGKPSNKQWPHMNEMVEILQTTFFNVISWKKNCILMYFSLNFVAGVQIYKSSLLRLITWHPINVDLLSLHHKGVTRSQWVIQTNAEVSSTGPHKTTSYRNSFTTIWRHINVMASQITSDWTVGSAACSG